MLRKIIVLFALFAIVAATVANTQTVQRQYARILNELEENSKNQARIIDMVAGLLSGIPIVGGLASGLLGGK